MIINYYTLCFGDNYLKNLFKITIPTLLDKKELDFKKTNLIIYSDNKKKVLSYSKKYLKNKKFFNINFISFENEILKFRQSKINQWKLLGHYQKQAYYHAKKSSAAMFILYPDEVYSENINQQVLKLSKNKNIIFSLSNEIFKKDFKNFFLKQNKNYLQNKKLLSAIKKYNFYNYINSNFVSSHTARYYFEIDNNLVFKYFHLTPIFINPKKIKINFDNFYTIDTYKFSLAKDQIILDPRDYFVLSLEDKIDIKYFKSMNFMMLFFFKIFYQVKFLYKNLSTINTKLFFKSFYLNKNHTSFSLKKFLLLDFFYFFLFFIYLLLKFFL